MVMFHGQLTRLGVSSDGTRSCAGLRWQKAPSMLRRPALSNSGKPTKSGFQLSSSRGSEQSTTAVPSVRNKFDSTLLTSFAIQYEYFRKLSISKMRHEYAQTVLEGEREHTDKMKEKMEAVMKAVSELERDVSSESKRHAVLSDTLKDAQNTIRKLENSQGETQGKTAALNEVLLDAKDTTVALESRIAVLEEYLDATDTLNQEREEEIVTLHALIQLQRQERVLEEAAEKAAKELWEKQTGTTVIFYQTSWRQAYIHFKADNEPWTKNPGMAMTNIGGHTKMIPLRCNKVEFCLNDGDSQWDAPQGNYQVTEPGVYCVASNKVRKLDWDVSTFESIEEVPGPVAKQTQQIKPSSGRVVQ